MYYVQLQTAVHVCWYNKEFEFEFVFFQYKIQFW